MQNHFCQTSDEDQPGDIARAVVASGDGHWFWNDINSDSVHWTPRLHELLGTNPADPKTIHCFSKCCHRDNRDRLTTAIERLISHKEGLDEIVRLRRTDGTLRWCRLLASPPNEHEPNRVCGVMRDVHDHWSNHLELEQTAAIFKQTHRLGRIGGWSLRRDGLRMRWTEEICDLHKLKPETPADLDTLLQCYRPDQAQRLRIAVDNALADATSFDMEVQIAGGSATDWLRIVGESEIIDGSVSQLHCAVMDISEIKRAEDGQSELIEALQTSNRSLGQVTEEAESAARAKAEFLANMSHEIRTPMTAMLGYTDLLLGGDITEEHQQRDALETIRRNGTHLLSIINDILDLSKLDAGHMNIERMPMSPHEVVVDVMNLLNVKAAEKNLELFATQTTTLPDKVICDPTRIRQILLNLVGNAIKFTQEGSVRIVMSQPEPGQLKFDVVDTGIGMTDDQCQKIFTAFQQADGSTSRKFGGTGLGLSISRRLTEMLGGKIKVESEPGKGTTFSSTIAAENDANALMHETYDKAIEALASKRSGAASTSSITLPEDAQILLAEDGPDNQRLIRFLLEKAGATVTIVENGQDAVHAALGEHGSPASIDFDVILMDVQMPVMDGYEATRQIRAGAYNRPIIALTAHAMSTVRDDCAAAGCDGYLSKPIDRTAFLNAVLEACATARNLNTTS